MAYFNMYIHLLTHRCLKMTLKITQAPGSDFTGTSLAVLKGTEQLLTDKFLFVTVFRCQM